MGNLDLRVTHEKHAVCMWATRNFSPKFSIMDPNSTRTHPYLIERYETNQRSFASTRKRLVPTRRTRPENRRSGSPGSAKSETKPNFLSNGSNREVQTPNAVSKEIPGAYRIAGRIPHPSSDRRADDVRALPRRRPDFRTATTRFPSPLLFLRCPSLPAHFCPSASDPILPCRSFLRNPPVARVPFSVPFFRNRGRPLFGHKKSPVPKPTAPRFLFIFFPPCWNPNSHRRACGG